MGGDKVYCLRYERLTQTERGPQWSQRDIYGPLEELRGMCNSFIYAGILLKEIRDVRITVRDADPPETVLEVHHYQENPLTTPARNL